MLLPEKAKLTLTCYYRCNNFSGSDTTSCIICVTAYFITAQLNYINFYSTPFNVRYTVEDCRLLGYFHLASSALIGVLKVTIIVERGKTPVETASCQLACLHCMSFIDPDCYRDKCTCTSLWVLICHLVFSVLVTNRFYCL